LKTSATKSNHEVVSLPIPALESYAAFFQRFGIRGDDVEQLLVDAALAQTVEGA